MENLAASYAANGELDKSIEYYRKTLEADPENYEILERIYEVVAAGGNPALCLDNLVALFEMRPDDPELALTLARAYRENSMVDEVRPQRLPTSRKLKKIRIYGALRESPQHEAGCGFLPCDDRVHVS